MPKWTHVVMHHSFTGDSTLPDTVAIKRFHTSYRQWGHILTQEEWEDKKEKGEDGLVSPWRDIGYHFVVERLSDGNPWVLFGRSLMFYGAHCKQQGMNRKGIGCCVVGNFDEAPPEEDVFHKAADHVAWLCRMYRIPVENVKAHRDFASYKSCPGEKFNMGEFRKLVEHYLDKWKPDSKKVNPQ